MAVARDFREIGPGIWLPFKYSITVYDERTIKEENKLVVSNRREARIEKAELDPHYDLSLFRDIPMPEHAAVYELTGGKITRSYEIGGESPPQTGRSKLWLMLFAGSVGASVALGAWLAKRWLSSGQTRVRAA